MFDKTRQYIVTSSNLWLFKFDKNICHGHSHSHGHDHSHGHGHSHGVYKHIGHPNGPRTMIDQGVCCCFMGQFPDHIVLEQRAILALADTNK